MKIKTTHDIIDEQFETKIEEHTLRTIRLSQPRKDVMEYRQKKWVAVDELIEVIDKLICIGNTQVEVFSNKKLNIIKEALENQLIGGKR